MIGRLALVAVTLLLVLVLCAPSGAARASPIAYPPTASPVSINETGSVTVEAIWIETTLPGVATTLGLPLNATGALVYPMWRVGLASSNYAAYAIYVGSLEILNGTVGGVHYVNFNVTGATVSVTIGFAGVTYQFANEVVAQVSVATPTPPPSPIYTAEQFTEAVFTEQYQAIAVCILAFFGALFAARKIVIINSQSRVSRIQ